MNRDAVVIAVLAACLALAGCQGLVSSGPDDIESTFDDGTDGWAIVGDAQDGSAAPAHESEGGDPGGHLSANDDVTGGVWYWAAPDRYLGEKADYEGGTLSVSLRQSATDSQFDARDVVIASDATELTYDFDAHPGTDWTAYEVPLSADGWTNGETGEPATDAEMQTVLASLDRVWIRGEYRTGSDTGRIDTVVLSAS